MQTMTAGVEILLRQALANHQAGRWGQAEPLYREALALDPEQPHILHLLGVLVNQMGQPEAAAALIRQAIARKPRLAEFHNSLGNALRALGDLPGAAASFEQALSIHPRSAEVYTNLGSLMEQAGNLEDAALCYLRALEIDPAYGDAHYTLGNLLKRAGNFEEAIEHYQRVADPACEYAAEALNNMGTALRRLGKPAEAVESFRKAVALRAPFFEAHLNLADALEEAGRLEEAARMYQSILSFKPDSAIAYSGAAGVMQDQGRPERATAAYRKALALAPQNALLHSNLLLNLHYEPGPGPRELLEAHQDWYRRHAQPLEAEIRRHPNTRDPLRPLRIGFVSPDFRRHPVGFYLTPVLASRPREGFEFICYSDAAVPDAVTERLAQGADLWRSTWTLEDPALAELIRADRVDILVDLAGHTRGHRLLVFARKPAPVQMTWAGYPDTTGLAQMDYLIGDRWQTPESSAAWYAEKILRLPGGYVCYSAPDYAPPVSGPPGAGSGHITFGCCNRLAKVNADGVRLWARLLRECSGSRLLIRSPGLGDEAVARRYRKMFSSEGVEACRVDLLDSCPHQELLGGYGAIDIALDPFPYSGGLTTCEALWMGVPVVTLAGERLASRHSAAHLSNVGLPELIATDPEHYLSIARDLAGDVGRLRSLRAGLRERVAFSPLGNGKDFTAGLLAQFRSAWQTWCEAGG